MALTFTLLALAVVALWIGGDGPASTRRSLWVYLALAATIAAVAQQILAPVAVVWLAGLVAASYGLAHAPARAGPILLCVAALVLLSVGLMLHRLPGFHNPRVLDGVRFTSDAASFSLYLNFDKTFVGLCLLGWLHPRITRAAEWRVVLAATLPRAFVLLFVVLLLALAAGYVWFAPKLPAETPLWLAVNLLFTCFAEEAFFRGFVQARLQRLLSPFAAGASWALVIAAVLFGFAHAAGGPTYVALATVAGLGYGWVYLRTQRIEASILTHFALNAAHFFLFTYPALAR